MEGREGPFRWRKSRQISGRGGNSRARDANPAIMLVFHGVGTLSSSGRGRSSLRPFAGVVAPEQQAQRLRRGHPGLRFRRARGLWHNGSNFSTSLRRLRWRGKTAVLPILSVRGETS
jgi:hypothetical protein